MSSFGVGPTGFTKMRLSDCKADLVAGLSQAFGAGTNTADATVFGQLAGVFAERYALLWEALEQVYNSNTVAAEGTSVDNILALNGILRLQPAPTVTNPNPNVQANGLTLNGLVLYGTPGTLVPAGTILQTSTLPTLSFTLDAPVTIGTAQNAAQQLLLSATPTAGSYAMQLTAPSGNVLTTQLIAYNASTQAIQAALAALTDTATGLYPFTDVVVAQPSSTLITLSFGAGTVAQGQPSSGSAQQATVGLSNNTLTAGSVAVNVAVSTTVTGSAAQAIGTATCTQNGANAAPAGTLTVIGSGVSGLTSVINQLDCLVGRLLETDTEAMTRRETLLASRGSGALPSLLSGVLALEDVTAAIAAANLTGAAQQVILFSQTPTKGSYQLAFQGTPTTTLAYNATAAQVQTAMGALPGLSNVLVTGSNVFGFTVDFNGSLGGQAEPLITVSSNSTDATITPYFGRPPNSVELVVQGGSNAEVANVIYNSLPAGIASYAQPVLRTLGSTVAGSTQVVLVSVVGLAAGQTLTGQGLYPGTVIQSVTGNTATVTPAALGSYSGVAMAASNAATVYDAAGNAHLVSFSRPTVVPLYIAVTLITDTYLTPGNPNSGVNPNAQFNPASVAAIQADLIAAANATAIGGTVLARGTNGLAGSFRSVPGLYDYTLAFDYVNPPVNQNNLPLPAEGLASAQSFNTVISYT